MAPPQIHQPHHFYLAWTFCLLATGRNTGKETLDNTVWIDAEPEHTTFHASNIGTYIRVIIPTVEKGSTWRRIVYDPAMNVKDIARKSKQVKPDEQGFAGVADQVLIAQAPTSKYGERVSFDYVENFGEGSFSTTIQALDLEWPYEIVAIYDRGVEEPAELEAGLPLMSAAFFASVTKFLGRGLDRSHRTATTTLFDATYTGIPEVRIQGCAATKVVS